MSKLTPEHDDMLRRVSNGLHVELTKAREQIERADRGLRVAREFEQRILGDIELIREVRS